jgi:hypothetical protein
MVPKFSLNGFEIAQWVNRVIDVDDFSVFKDTNDMEDAVYCLDMRQKVITETGAFSCALDESRNVGNHEISGLS